MRTTALFVAAFVALLAGSRPGGAQEPSDNGSVAGQVRDEVSGEPLVGARVSVVGILRATLTNDEGRYTLTGVPAGQREVRVNYIGYAPMAQTITVTAGAPTTADFALRRSAVELSAIITTATGQEQAAREIGNAVSNIAVDEVDLAPVRNFSDLVQGRASGVSVLQSSGTSGSGARIRIRGSNSVSLSNSPLLIVDGVRVDDNPDSFILFTGGQTTSRLNDFSPESIESIEIIKGPAAAALYGTAAANGVIQITTRRGTTGPARWSMWSEYTDFDRNYRMPDNVLYAEQTVDGLAPCDFLTRAGPGCTVDTILRSNPLENPETTPFRNGSSQRYGMSVSGGQGTTYFLSAELFDETGLFEENDIRRVNLRANLSGTFRDVVDLSASAGYVDTDLQLPQNDNSGLGVLTNGLTAQPTAFFVDNFQGYALPREYLFAWDQFQNMTRATIGGQATWRPLSWLSVNGVAGLDNVQRHDNDLFAPGVTLLFGPPFSLGFRESQNFTLINYTANLGAVATYAPTNDVVLTSSLGTQYHRDYGTFIFAQGVGITPGTGSLGGTTRDFGVGEASEETITLGTYFQQQLAWQDRLFLTGAVRGDRNNAFGTDLGWIWYPSFSASWVIGEEPFFPQTDVISELRLRAAWGQSGLRPGFRDALKYYIGVTAVNVGTEVPGFVIDEEGAGNASLKPERSTELEVGFDVGFFDDRLGLEVTYYTKESKDALVQRTFPPSLGGAAVRFDNLGRVTNRGWEFGLNATPVQTNDVLWTVTMLGSGNRNRLESLGGLPPIIFGLNGNTQRHEEGHPLGGYWQPAVTYSDADGNGTITEDEVTIGDDVFLGSPFPTRELSFRTEVLLWDRVRISGLLDHKGGHKMFNATKWGRCVSPFIFCEERYADPGSMADQAAIIAAEASPTSSLAGFFEDADFWRLREISLTYMLPSEWVSRFGAQGLNVTLASRNVATWTDYTGFDPEVNADAQLNFNTSDNNTLPPHRTWVFRFDVNF